MHVGAGTVLSSEQLTMMQDAGGEYMITPNVNVGLIRDCISRGISADNVADKEWIAAGEWSKITAVATFA